MNAERLKDVLSYFPDMGIFVWRTNKSRKAKVGFSAGTLTKDRYIRICVDGKCYLAHRLAWLYVYGSFPCGNLDHKNTIKYDNRIENLREATRPQNGANMRSRRNGLKGAYFHKVSQMWCACIRIKGTSKHLGSFDSESEAHAAYVAEAEQFHGEFARAE